MFDRNYYYLVAGLPDIILDQKKLNFSLAEFKDEMRSNLHEADYKLVEMLFLPLDNQNLLNILTRSDKPFDEGGKFSQDQIEEEIREPGYLPEYMQRIITAYKSETPLFENMSWEDQLTWLFYEYLGSCTNKFLTDWFDFDLSLRNIVAGINIRKYKLKSDKYLVGNNNVVQAVKKSTLKDFGLSNDFGYMEKIINIQENENLLERERAMDIIRWEFLDEKNTFNYFTVEVLLAYVIKLQLVQRWMKLDLETGKQMFRRLLDQLEQSYEFPKEFMINEKRK